MAKWLKKLFSQSSNVYPTTQILRYSDDTLNKNQRKISLFYKKAFLYRTSSYEDARDKKRIILMMRYDSAIDWLLKIQEII